MVKLIQYSKKTTIPKGDYIFDKMEKVYDTLSVLTPKFSGKWTFVLIDPKIKFAKELIENATLPEWVDFLLLVSTKKLNNIVLDYPQLQPKKKTRKEEIEEIIIGLKHMLDESAKRYLIASTAGNVDEIRNVLTKLDNECKEGRITIKQVKGAVHYTKRVYASDVINAFLKCEKNRWQLYETLMHDLGDSYAYNACYSYVKDLLKEKQAYLINEDTKNFTVQQVDAPLICYTYVLFSNSKSCKQLYEILYCIENRSKEHLELMQN